MKDCGTISIVDHDEAFRLTAVQVAVRLGYEVRPTPTADELLDRLGPDRPTLAIVEVELREAAKMVSRSCASCTRRSTAISR